MLIAGVSSRDAAEEGPTGIPFRRVIGETGYMTQQFLITGDLARAGRALAQVSFNLVAQRASVDPEQYRSFERGTLEFEDSALESVREALEYYGVEFLDEDEHTGYGVRQKFNQRKVKRIENWENEGGPAYEDDI